LNAGGKKVTDSKNNHVHVNDNRTAMKRAVTSLRDGCTCIAKLSPHEIASQAEYTTLLIMQPSVAVSLPSPIGILG
jgi:hypothetical protein